jgi:tetratricopeptide (TPR) repeat protein
LSNSPPKKPKLPIEGATSDFASFAGLEIPKPKDWQAFQRACVILYQEELQDPNAKAYGRHGQGQDGIDILGKRNGDRNHRVGIQCKRIAKPLTKKEIREHCDAAIKLDASLKEIIFATTAPDDTKATRAAIAVERELEVKGYSIHVEIFGWESLQVKICQHPKAVRAFYPSAFASQVARTDLAESTSSTNLATDVASIVVERLEQSGVVTQQSEIDDPKLKGEDPGLHARIDTLRDLFTKHQQFVVAESEFLKLLDSDQLDEKPWAQFRVHTNLASIEIDLGRQAEAAKRFRIASNIRPHDSMARANLALAHTIEGDYETAMSLAREALQADPPAKHAVGYLLQAAALSSWEGDPGDLIPPHFKNTKYADLGLAEFYRRRKVPDWQIRCLEIAARHPDIREIRHNEAVAILSMALGEYQSDDRQVPSPEQIKNAADWMVELANLRLSTGFADTHDLSADVNNAALLLRISGRHAECEAL